MLKSLPVLIFSLISTVSLAQYIPTSNQAYQYLSLFNPAFAGVEKYTDLKLSYLDQWGNLPGSPKTINVVLTMRLNQPLDLSNSSLRPGNPSQVGNPDFIPKKKRIFHALAANAFNQQFGPTQLSGGGLTYSFHYPLSKKLTLSGGTSAIIESVKVDPNSITFRDDNDPYTQYLLNNNVKQTDLNIRAGVLLYGKNFYVGASYFPVLNKSIQSTNTLGDHPFYRASVQLGYSFPVSANLILKPSAVALVQMDNTFSVDYSLKAYIQNKLMLGACYRNIQTAVFFLGFSINDLLGVSYSYEMSLNGFKQFNDGSHELVLSVKLNNFKKLNPYAW
jgi:type IX secretion system PorP/SprF family membrane protein